MGLIRKSLFLGSLGVVRANSKKQRVAKASLKEARKQTQILNQQARTAPVQQDQVLPPAGWMDDPKDPALLRWWDGVAWSGHTKPRGS